MYHLLDLLFTLVSKKIAKITNNIDISKTNVNSNEKKEGFRP